MKTDTWVKVAAAVLCLIGSTGVTLAAPVMALTLDGAPGWHNNFSNSNVGFSFTTHAELYVTHLGIFDYEGNGLASYGVEVGLFEADGTCLGSEIVYSADPLDRGFRFTEVSEPFILADNTEYYAIAYLNSSEQVAAQSSIATDPNITFGTNVESYGGPFKLITSGLGSGWDAGFLGPNFKTVVTPEPASALLLLAGGAVVVAKRRRKRGSSVTPAADAAAVRRSCP